LIIKDNRAYQGFDEDSLLDFVATQELEQEQQQELEQEQET
jgi:hypothetical protein